MLEHAKCPDELLAYVQRRLAEGDGLRAWPEIQQTLDEQCFAGCTRMTPGQNCAAWANGGDGDCQARREAWITHLLYHDCVKPAMPATPASRSSAITTRNLIYHCCPLSANDVWRKNVDQIKRRWDVFNGRKIVAIAIGDGMESAAAVAEQLGRDDAEFVVCENDPILRETATLPLLLEEVQSTRDDEATFFAHTKGNATLETNHGTMSDADRIVGATRWRNAMYHHLLDRADECMEHLKTVACVGTTQMIVSRQRRFRYPSGLMLRTWMFAGTFFWFRNDAVFSHPNWQNIPKDRYGAEAWIGGLIPPGRSHSMFQPWDLNTFPAGSPYDPVYYSEEFDDG